MADKKSRAFDHPCRTPHPFVELKLIKEGNIMVSYGGRELVLDGPVDIEGGSFFTTAYREDGRLFYRSMMGSSDERRGSWTFSREQTVEITKGHPHYQHAVEALGLEGQ